MAKADEAAREGEERLVDVVAPFIADAQAAAAMQPGQGAFDDPAMAAEALASLTAARRVQSPAAVAHTPLLVASSASPVEVPVKVLT